MKRRLCFCLVIVLAVFCLEGSWMHRAAAAPDKDDLECFNDRTIADSIYSSKIPTVTGIGHQIDISIADMVADQNFITPTATATFCSEIPISAFVKLKIINVSITKIIIINS